MKNLLSAVVTSLLLFSFSACAVGFGEQFPPEPTPGPPYAYPYPYPPTSYYPGAYVAPPAVAFGFGFGFGGHREHFEHGGRFAHAGHSRGHGWDHRG